MQGNRRSFLKQCGGTTAAAVACSALAGPVVLPAAAQEVAVTGASPGKRSLVTGRCLLELDGALCGWLWWVEGGGATADVVEEPPGSDGLARKHLAAARYEDLILCCGAGLNQPFYDWMKSLFTRQTERKTGAVIYLDHAGREVSRLVFTQAFIVEVGFPALDAVWKDPAVLAVKLRPESTRLSRDGAGRLFNFDAKPRRRWLPSNFRLSINGLEDAAASVLRVEALIVSQGLAQNASTGSSDRPNPSGALQVSDVVVSLPPAHSQFLEAWFEDFVVKGNNAAAQEKGGTLEFLSLDERESYFTLSFEHLGIYRLEPVLFDAGNRPLPLLQARMYCGGVRFAHRIARA